MKYSINKNIIHLLKKPTKKGFIEVYFKPSNYWINNHKTELPMIYTEIEIGQTEYKLPSYFKSRNITKIIIK